MLDISFGQCYANIEEIKHAVSGWLSATASHYWKHDGVG